MVSWSDLGGDVSGTGYAIRAQVFTADGTKIGEELVVDIGNQANSAEITALPNGTFVVTWVDHVGDFEATISAQVFTAGGDKIGSTSSVSHADISSSHQITPLLHTGFVVTWEDKVVTNEGYSWAVKAQVFAADGTKIGDEILVNTATDSDQWDPNIAALSSSDFVVTWSSYDLPNGQSDIRGNLLSLPDIVNDTAITNEDTPVNILVLANDTFDGTPAITGTTNGAHGTVAVNNNGTPANTADDLVVYTPAADFNGTDKFTYTVTSGGVTETATVSVTVTAVADIVNDILTIAQDSGARNLDLLANDTFENPGRSITAVGGATHGTAPIRTTARPALPPTILPFTHPLRATTARTRSPTP